MNGASQAIHRLRAQISAVEDVLSELKAQLAVAEQSRSCTPANHFHGGSYESEVQCQRVVQNDQKLSLELEEYKRYGRQMILPEIGIDGPSSSALSTIGGPMVR